MNGDTPKKPAEGDWQTDKHDPSDQGDTQKPQNNANEVVVANLRDDSAAETPAAQDQPEAATMSEEQSSVEELPPAVQDQSVSDTPQAPPASEAAPRTTAGWATTMNGESAWDLADAEMEAHDNQVAPEMPSIQWTASEFIAHEKSPMWYLSLIAIGAVLAIFSQLVVHDIITTVAIILVTILFVFVASHKPRTLPYRIDDAGVTIGDKTYPYAQFKSFGIVQEGAFSNITLVPLKRFGPPLSIYYPPEEEEKIVQVLSAYMPTSQVKLDLIDRLLKSIHL